MEGVRAAQTGAADETDALRALLREHREALLSDAELLADLGLRRAVDNVVEFGPAAISRAAAAHRRESSERQRLEAITRANFDAQARTRAAVIELIGSADHTDLARRVDAVARTQFGLLAGVVALEGAAPTGWRPLARGQLAMILGRRAGVRLGVAPTATGLFGDLAPIVGSVALARLALAGSGGVLAFAAADADGFAADMGADLVRFLARIVESTAARWPH